MPSETVVKFLACAILGLGTLCFYIHPLCANLSHLLLTALLRSLGLACEDSNSSMESM